PVRERRARLPGRGHRTLPHPAGADPGTPAGAAQGAQAAAPLAWQHASLAAKTSGWIFGARLSPPAAAAGGPSRNPQVVTLWLRHEAPRVPGQGGPVGARRPDPARTGGKDA